MSTGEALPRAREIAVLTICAGAQNVDLISEALSKLPGPYVCAHSESHFSGRQPPSLPPRIATVQTCVALVEFDGDHSAASETAAILHQIFPGKVFAVAITSNRDSDTLVQIMRAGFAEALPKPLDGGTVSDLFQRLERRWSHALPVQRSGRILSFCGAKGGVGTSSLAVHLAVQLRERHHKRVLLIDNHLELGHICLYLGMQKSPYGFEDLLRNVERLDADLLDGFVAKDRSGIHVLGSPDQAGASPIYDPETLQRVADCLRAEYDFVILDNQSFSAAVMLSNLGARDHLTIIATPEMGAIRDVARYIERLDEQVEAGRKPSLIMNRCSAKNTLTWSEINEVISIPVRARIPNAYGEVVSAINLGRPISTDARTEFAAELRSWSDSLVETVTIKGASRKHLKWFWK